jgi:hypothetical protein
MYSIGLGRNEYFDIATYKIRINSYLIETFLSITTLFFVV